MISYTLETVADTGLRNASHFTESGATNFASAGFTYSSSYTTNDAGATFLSTSSATGRQSIVSRDTFSTTGVTYTASNYTFCTSVTSGAGFEASSMSSTEGHVTTGGALTNSGTGFSSGSTTGSALGTNTVSMVTSTTSTRSAAWNFSSAATAAISFQTISSETYASSTSTLTSYFLWPSTTLTNITQGSFGSVGETFITTTSGSFTRSFNAPYLTDTVIIPELNEVVWTAKTLSVNSSSGSLHNVADSFTVISTIEASNLMSAAAGSSSYAYVSSSTTFATFSTVTVEPMTVTVVGFDSASTRLASPVSGRFRFLGTFPVSSYDVTLSDFSVTSTAVSAASVSASYRSIASAPTITIAASTTSYLTNSEFGSAIFWDDFNFPDDVNFVGRPRRTTTLSSQISTTVQATSYSEGLPFVAVLTSPANTSSATYNRDGATGVTVWNSRSIIPTLYREPGLFATAHTHFTPSTAAGMGPLSSAGNQANVYRHITCAGDFLGNYYFAPDNVKSLLMNAAVYGIVPFDSAFGLSFSTTNTDEFFEGIATAKFLTAPVTGALQATLGLTLPDDTSTISGELVFGFESATAESGHSSRTGAVFGGMAAISGVAQTDFYPIGRRVFTNLDSSGGSTTGSTDRSHSASSALPVSALHLESFQYVFTASASTGVITRTGATFTTTPITKSDSAPYPSTGIL